MQAICIRGPGTTNMGQWLLKFRTLMSRLTITQNRTEPDCRLSTMWYSTRFIRRAIRKADRCRSLAVAHDGDPRPAHYGSSEKVACILRELAASCSQRLLVDHQGSGL